MDRTKLTRKDFLKLSTLSAAALYKLSFQNNIEKQAPNILLVIYDSWSTTNLYLDGYSRNTMPNLKRLAEKAIVYHNHYSGSNFTSPGTASLLTGTSTKIHRAFSGNSKVIPALEDKNLFSQFKGASYNTFAYTHNHYADTLLRQFSAFIDDHIPLNSLFLNKSDLMHKLFSRDFDTAFLSSNQILEDSPHNSLLLSKLYEKLETHKIQQIQDTYGPNFPDGIPKTNNNYFVLEDATDHIIENIKAHPTPYLGYYHLLPPHDPYNPPEQFFNHFLEDGAKLPDFPEHILSEGHKKGYMREQRKKYDEYLLYVDHEINRLYQSLEKEGALQNTILVITSDHGELNDRGFIHHGKATLHEPVIRIPLFIFMPGQDVRVDITERTTALDILPTLLAVAGQPSPDFCEGAVLPPFAEEYQANQIPFLIIHSTTTHANQKVKTGSMMIMHERYKLTKYLGYKQINQGEAVYEMYDLANDPQELNDIYLEEPKTAARMIAELDRLLADEDLAE